MPKTLLLADDSITIQKVVGITFVGEDFKIVAVQDGEEALARARVLKPDVILADVVMPKRNGYELCEAVKADPELRQVPVLLLAGTFEAFDDARARAAGADGHIAKPFESQALINKVKELVGMAPAPSAPAPRPPAPSGGPTGSALPGANPIAPAYAVPGAAPTPPQGVALRPLMGHPPVVAPPPGRPPVMGFAPPGGRPPMPSTPPPGARPPIASRVPAPNRGAPLPELERAPTAHPLAAAGAPDAGVIGGPPRLEPLSFELPPPVPAPIVPAAAPSELKPMPEALELDWSDVNVDEYPSAPAGATAGLPTPPPVAAPVFAPVDPVAPPPAVAPAVPVTTLDALDFGPPQGVDLEPEPEPEPEPELELEVIDLPLIEARDEPELPPALEPELREVTPPAVAPAAPIFSSSAPSAPREAAPSAPDAPHDGGEAQLREALSQASREVIERIAWEIVPQLAETLIREQIDRLVKARQQ